MSEKAENLAKRLAEARASEGLTQTQLAGLIGIQTRQIARYEAGDALPRPGTLLKLADALQTTSEWLSGEVEIGLIDQLPENLASAVKALAYESGVEADAMILQLLYTAVDEQQASQRQQLIAEAKHLLTE